MNGMISVRPKFTPELDPGFVPAVLWDRAFAGFAKGSGKAEKLAICLKRNNGAVSRRDTLVLPHDRAENRKLNVFYAERLLKRMLWMFGGQTVTIAGDGELAAEIARIYSPEGERAFDHDFFGDKVYGKGMQFISCPYPEAPEASEIAVRLGRNLDGVRIGFDLGGSDRKAAVVVDGEVVFSEETKWDPYFQEDSGYHLAGIRDTIAKAIARIPPGRKLDAIGGSAAGVYVDNQVRIASLFRGVQKANGGRLPEHVVNIFETLRKEYGVPLVVMNDGEVTALAGSMAMKADSILGVSMGTSVAGGYVTPKGTITDWLNEFAFMPCDYRDDGPKDEWSGDKGCCVQYFCQQGVARLAQQAGLVFPADMKHPERLERVQEMMAHGDRVAERIYESIGVMFGYTVAMLADFYEIRKLLILGRVTSGKGGDLLLRTAAKVLEAEAPEVARKLEFTTPDEKSKRHGQAIAAASLPELGQAGQRRRA